MAQSTRLTILLSPEDEQYWQAAADEAQETLGRFLRERVRRALAEHEQAQGAARQIPVAPDPVTQPVQITLPEPLYQQLALAAERLGYDSLAALVRVILAQDTHPWARLAHSLGLRSGAALQQAVLRGAVALVALPPVPLATLVALLQQLLATGQWPAVPTAQQSLAQLLQAVASALPAAAGSPERQEPPGAGTRCHADTATLRLEWLPFAHPTAPTMPLPFTPADYGGKFAGFLRALRVAWGGAAPPDITVTRPESLGDSAEEVLQSLSLWAETGCGLAIAQPAALREHREHTPAYTARELLLAGLDSGAKPAEGSPPEWYFQVAYPSSLGTSYTDLMASLSLLAERRVRLLVAQPQPGCLSFSVLLEELL